MAKIKRRHLYRARWHIGQHVDLTIPPPCREFMPELDMGGFAFAQPDGTPLGYTFPGDKKCRYRVGPKFFAYKPRFQVKYKRRRLHPKLHVWKDTHKKQWIVFCDIDKLFKDENRCASLWGWGRKVAPPSDTYHNQRCGYKVLAQFYQDRVGEHGFVFNTPKSGRPKVAFCIEYKNEVKRPRTRDIIALFKLYFPKLMRKGHIDVNRGAMSGAFIDWKDRAVIADGIASLKPIVIETNTKQISFRTTRKTVTVETNYKYLMLDKVPHTLQKYAKGWYFEQFIRMLASIPALARKGFGLSQKVIAKTIGCHVSTAHRMIQKAISLNLIKVKNHEYIIDEKAKTYVASGKLKVFLKHRIKKAVNKKLPKAIKDGCWHRQIVRACSKVFRYKQKAFLPWLTTIPGHDFGDRYEQAEAFQQWLIRKHPELAATL